MDTLSSDNDRSPDSKDSLLFPHLNFVNLKDQASTIEMWDAKNRQSPESFKKLLDPSTQLPHPLQAPAPSINDDVLYEEWYRLIALPRAGMLPVLVSIPRGANGASQFMAACAQVSDGGVVNIRWLHCQYVAGAHAA